MLAGLAVEAVALYAGATVSLPPQTWWAGVLAVVCAGFVAGTAVGKFSEGRDAGGITGFAVGVIGGVAFVVVGWESMTLALPQAHGSPFWVLNYLVATTLAKGQAIAPAYSEAIVVVVLVGIAVAWIVEAAVAGAAMAIAPGAPEPPAK